jgi:iron complex outermembrane recepter protein
MLRFLAALSFLLISSPVIAIDKEFYIDIKGTSLNELVGIKITSLSKKRQTVSAVPAAVYVLTRDEILRMGVTHLAEALRYVPGIEVVRRNASQWAISIRGFNSRTANKLLVMIDGRSLYSTFFSGVLWEEQDMVLEEIERIEIIRGPGGAIWGSNAVNGVINIITRNSADIGGAQVRVSATTENRTMLLARHNWQIDSDSSLRIYAKHRKNEASGGLFENDDYQHTMLGFRFDKLIDKRQQLMLQGNIYSGNIGKLGSTELPGAKNHRGNHLLLRWQIKGAENMQHQMQAYYDATRLETDTIVDDRYTVDFDYQNLIDWDVHQVVLGVGHRLISDKVEAIPFQFIQPVSRDVQVTSAFIQDEMKLSDRIRLTLGGKIESNHYSGTEWLPSIRLSYQISGEVFWGSYARAARVPTRLEQDIETPSLSGETFGTEYVNYYEIGWRKDWKKEWLLDITIFEAYYSDLLTVETNTLANNMSGRASGAEISANLQVLENWLMKLNYSYLDLSLTASANSIDDTRAFDTEGRSPQSSFNFVSLLDINPQWQVNTYFRYVNELKADSIDSYWAADISILWAPSENFSFGFVGRHLGNSHHEEWTPGITVKPQYGIILNWNI